ncbi:MAG: Gfo/Idh/MocA family oxidoreductase [Firmicutes bacterium]|nr:Gfo/Idh/MocA family oxidoreductase [Bacillota bacterium]
MGNGSRTRTEVGIGLVGYGFIGRVHTLGYMNMPMYYRGLEWKPRLAAVCSRSEANRREAVEEAGYAWSCPDFRELVTRDDVRVVDCCTPNDTHLDIALAALEAGKHVYCEKPLARNVAEAREMAEAAREAGRRAGAKTQVACIYRFIPAVMRAKQLIDEGALGRIFHFRAAYLHSGYVDPMRPVSWRLSKAQGGAGAIYDLGAHILDLMYYLLGDYVEVMASLETFIKERPSQADRSVMVPVDVDDFALIQARMENGAIGTIEVSRVATGANDELRFEIHGSGGALAFNLMDPNWLWFYDNTRPGSPIGGLKGYTKIETIQKFPEPGGFPGPKFAVGWIRFHFASEYEFLASIQEGRPTTGATFEDGLRIHEVMGAAMRSSEERGWVKV